MTNEHLNDFSSLPVPRPYLVSATDLYYGVTPSREDLEPKKKTPSSVDGAPYKKMRILITTFWDYPAVGGLQNYITTLKANLEKLGHIVDVVAPNQFSKEVVREMKKKITEETKQFYINRYGCYSDKIVKQNVRLAIYEMMLSCIDLEKYDVFHAQDRFTANILGRLNLQYQKPLFFTPHGFMTQRRLKFDLIERGSVEETYFWAMDRKAIEYADHVIMLCEAFRSILKNLGAKDRKMTTVYTGIDFHSNDRVAKKPKDKLVITCISRLRPRKGHEYLLDALSLMEKKLKNAEIWIVGDGEMREELENQAKSLKLKNISFLGTRMDVIKLLNQSDIFVLPTTSDTLPITIIEAMFAQKAIVTTNCGGIPEIIQDQHSGLIAEPKNAQQLAEKLLLLLNDKALRETLAKNAREFAEMHLTSMNMAKKVEEIYKSFQCKGSKKNEK